jgi:hypothetical protein
MFTKVTMNITTAVVSTRFRPGKYYKRPEVPQIRQPDDSVFATLNGAPLDFSRERVWIDSRIWLTLMQFSNARM